MIANLPAYTKDSKNQVFGSVVESLEAWKALPKKGLALADYISKLSNAKLEDGFGTGLLILSSTELDAGLRERFDVVFAFDIKVERNVLAIVSKRDLADVEIPNWNKTAGATLPGWADQASRDELIKIIYNQLNVNVKEIINFKKSGTSSKDAATTATHDLLASKFLIGVCEALFYARPKDFANMQCQRIMKKTNEKGKVIEKVITESPIERIVSIGNALTQHNVEGQIADIIAKIKAKEA